VELSKLLKEKIERKIDSWNAEIEAAEATARARQEKAQSEAADAEFESELWGRVKELRDRVSRGRKYLEDLTDAGEEKAAQIKAKIAGLLD
jgi:hypothetical protein